jgi:hypothetical protein
MTCVIHVEERSAAAPAAVFALLARTEGWPEWSSMSKGELEEPAPGSEPEGVGALRRFTTGRRVSRERVVVFDPDRQLSYELLSGLPLGGYRADVTLAPTDDGGTLITWHSTFRPARRATGWLYRAALGRFIARTARQLARGAERTAATR